MNAMDKIIANHMNIFAITKIGKKRLYKAMKEWDEEFLNKVYYSRNTPLRVRSEIDFFWTIKLCSKKFPEAIEENSELVIPMFLTSEDVRKGREAMAKNLNVPKEVLEALKI